jgi:hypothetical protein
VLRPDAHAFEHALLHAMDDGIVDLAMRGAAPRAEHIGLCQHVLRQPCCGLQRGGAGLQLANQRSKTSAMQPCIAADRASGRELALVLEDVPSRWRREWSIGSAESSSQPYSRAGLADESGAKVAVIYRRVRVPL